MSTGLAAGQATAVSCRGSTSSSGCSSRGEGPLKMPMLQDPCSGGGAVAMGGLDSGLWQGRAGRGWAKRASEIASPGGRGAVLQRSQPPAGTHLVVRLAGPHASELHEPPDAQAGLQQCVAEQEGYGEGQAPGEVLPRCCRRRDSCRPWQAQGRVTPPQARGSGRHCRAARPGHGPGCTGVPRVAIGVGAGKWKQDRHTKAGSPHCCLCGTPNLNGQCSSRSTEGWPT